MTEVERQELISAVREALVNHPCRFDISENLVDQVVLMLETVGEGNVSRGVQRCLKNHEWLMLRRARDDEYTENHKAVSAMRKSAGSVAEQLRRGVMWGFILAAALALVLGVKLGFVKP